MKTQTNSTTLSLEDVKTLLKKAEGNEFGNESALIGNLTRLVLILWQIIAEKKVSISRLRRLIFGSKSEKREQPQEIQSSEPLNQADKGSQQTLSQEQTNSGSKPSTKRKKGHGRLSAKLYTQAKIVNCVNKEISAESDCPKECGGRLYDTKKPQPFIRLEGGAILSATNYVREVLRCRVCGQRFTAKLPDGIKYEKYDVTADVSLTIHKYEAALPFYRTSQIQNSVGVPIASSTQFSRTEALADKTFPIYRELERVAAISKLLHQDDTTVRILSLMKENKQLPKDARKATYTTGIAACSDTYNIVLYYSGRKYSGENLAELLKKRPLDLEKALVVADAEHKNWLDSFKERVIKCLCLAHSRRKFVDCEAAYPEKCKKVLDDLAQVYHNDSLTKSMTPAQRLDYHQKHSKLIMDELQTWIVKQLDENIEEESSSLGKALNYMKNQWYGLTQFLRVTGVPLDNNFLERLLRKVVVFRKNALFYKTQHGAMIGDIHLSIIGTCKLNSVNPFEYLTTIANNASDVRKNPSKWLPWNYLEAKT